MATPGRAHHQPVGITAVAAAGAARRAPTLSLSGIVGAGARRREDIGAARFGAGIGEATFRPPTADTNAKPLRPSVTRAAGRTTMPSSSRPSSSPGGRGSKINSSFSSNPSTARESPRKETVAAAASSAARVDSGCRKRTDGRYCETSNSKAADGKEDVLGLSWAYGNGGGGFTSGGDSSGGGGPQKRCTANSATNRGARGEGEGKGRDEVELTGPGKIKRKREGTRPVPGRQGCAADVGKVEVALSAKPPAEAHPAGYMDGTVVVPAQSRVFLTMPQRCGVRADGSRTNEGAKKLVEIQV